MAQQTLELSGLASRLERIEKENRWWRTWIVSLLLPICLVVMGQANRRVVEAESFVLRDAAGIKRAELAMGQDNAALYFFGLRGQQSSFLSFLFLTPEERPRLKWGM